MSGKMSTKSPWPLSMFDSNANKIRSAAAATSASSSTPSAAATKSGKPNKTTTTTTVKVSNKNRISTTITRSISRSNSNNNNSNHTNNLNNNNNNNSNNNNSNANYDINHVNNNVTAVVRPNTLNVTRNGYSSEAKTFIREALNAWRTKARCNVVPAERLQELFHELQFNPSERQIGEMLQTAKVFARKGSKQLNGLTFGEFCVLAADLKRFRTCSFTPSSDNSRILSSLPGVLDPDALENACSSIREKLCPAKTDDKVQQKLLTNSTTNETSPSRKNSDANAPEVFLGGSCNPTTWRADVAIPTLQNLGISFYNPQVSDWTPDLIELEHRAKEKARVLFFVMDSETRASAGAIEAAHIAGQNSRHLVLVLHPYQPKQSILNEPVSPQEYLDLCRNQQLLRELVTRRGLPVLDNIPSGLQQTKAILAGIRDPPSNIASILIVVRGAFDRVASSPKDEEITIQQCQRALSLLGYADSLLSMDNLKHIIRSHRETMGISESPSGKDLKSNMSPWSSSPSNKNNIRVNYDEFCVLAAYLSVLQQEIHESGCISPIKGINLPPPPIFLANMQEGIHNRNGDENVTITTSSSFSKQVFRTSSSTSVPDERNNRDSGTSSPQPLETGTKSKYMHVTGKKSKICLNIEFMENSEESDSNDSVFSSGSSINSTFFDSFCGLEFRDVYLGGSCFLRSKWRQDYAIPYLNSKGVTYHMPTLHESILPSQLNILKNNSINEKTTKQVLEDSSSNAKKSRVKRKDSLSKLNQSFDSGKDDEDDFEQPSSPLAIRPTLYNPAILDSSRVLLFIITNETRSLAPMTLAAHCIGLMYNVVLCVQMLPENCVIGNEKLTPTAIKDYNRGRSYLIDLAKRQNVPVFNDLKSALQCTVEKVKACRSSV